MYENLTAIMFNHSPDFKENQSWLNEKYSKKMC